MHERVSNRVLDTQLVVRDHEIERFGTCQASLAATAKSVSTSFLSAFISVDQRPIDFAFRDRRKPIADSPVISLIKFPANSACANPQVTRAYFLDSKRPHKILEVTNSRD